MTGQTDREDTPDVAERRTVRRTAAVRSKAARSAEKATARYQETRKWLDRTTAGELQRKIVAVDLVNQALIFAALALMLVVPLLLCLAALVPLGDPHGLAVAFAHRAGLSPQATKDLQSLFPSRQTIRTSVTWVSIAVTLVSAFSWPAVLQRGYEHAWRLPALGWRERWRPLVWLLSFVVGVTASTAAAGVLSGWVGRIVLVLVGFPVVTGWAWWGQHFLLGGRIGWRALFPGAVAIAIGLFAFRLYGVLFFSLTITSNYDKYGALGVVLIVLSALIFFSVVMFGGAVVGITLRERPLRWRRRPEPRGAQEG